MEFSLNLHDFLQREKKVLMKLSGLLASTLLASASANVIPSNNGPLKLSFNKFKGETFEKATSNGQGDVQFDLKNQQNFYSVDLEVGTPAQRVTVLLDTGSSDLWVTGSGNPYCSPDTRDAHLSSSGSNMTSNVTTQAASATSSFPSSSATVDCSQYGTFSMEGSETFKSNESTFYLTYGDGSFAKGTWGIDHVYLDGLNVSGVSFAVANETNSTVGVFGIGLPGNEASVTPGVDGQHYQYMNFPQMLKHSGVVQKNAYSLFLNSPDAEEGSILFGAVDHSKYTGQLYTLPLVSQGSSAREFDVTLQGISVQNSSSQVQATSSSLPALLDSGTTLMYLPATVADSVAGQLGGRYSASTGYYLIPKPSSDDDTKIVFDFGGFHIETSLSNYLMQGTSGSDDVSVLGILRTDSERAILGDVFLVDAYVVYDLEDYEISLAQASYSGASEDIELIVSSIPSATRASSYSQTGSSDSGSTTASQQSTTTSQQASQTSQQTSQNPLQSPASSSSSSSSDSTTSNSNSVDSAGSSSSSSSSDSSSDSYDSSSSSSSSSSWANKVVETNGVATVRADWQLLAVATLLIQALLL